MEHRLFDDAEEFRVWLSNNCTISKGLWLLFGKEGGPITIGPNEALEEALCFGWIDSQIKSLDSYTYIKYFRQGARAANGQTRTSPWLKNRKKAAE